METVFVCLLYFITFFALLRERYVLAGLCAGAAVALRLESVFLAGVTVVAPLLYHRGRFWRTLGATLLLPVLVYLWAWAYFGSPLANSTLAKRIVYSPAPLQAVRICLATFEEGLQFGRLWPRSPIEVQWAHDARVVLWLPFLGLGYLFVRRRAPAASLTVAQPIGAFAFYGLANPMMFPWYHCTFAPLASLFALLGVVAVGERLPSRRLLRPVATLAAIGWLSIRPILETWWPLFPPTDPRFRASLPNAGPHARVYQYANIARWLNERTAPTDRLCASEIGAVGYYYHGKILDALGLVSPAALPYHPNPLRISAIHGAIPPPLVHDLRPDYVLSMDIFASHLFADGWFQQHYALIGRWGWYGGPSLWRGLSSDVWGGHEVRVYRRLDAP